MKMIFNRSAMPFVMLFISFLFATQLYSQSSDRMTKDEWLAKELTNKMNENLLLNEAQYKIVYVINLEYVRKNKEILSTSTSKEDQFKKIRFTQNNRNRRLETVLTEKQCKDFEKMKSKVKSETKEYIIERRKR